MISVSFFTVAAVRLWSLRPEDDQADARHNDERQDDFIHLRRHAQNYTPELAWPK
jgi:hypothetical protein